MRWLRYGLLGILTAMFVVRAGVEVKRMVTERPSTFHPEITACGQKPMDNEGMMVWQFRNLEVRGTECEVRGK